MQCFSCNFTAASIILQILSHSEPEKKKKGVSPVEREAQHVRNKNSLVPARASEMKNVVSATHFCCDLGKKKKKKNQLTSL